MKRTRIAMLIAVVTYMLAWLLPVVDGGTTILSGGVFWGLLSAALLNTHWFFVFDDRSDLFIGYYTWVASFVILAAAAYGLGNDGQSDPMGVVT